MCFGKGDRSDHDRSDDIPAYRYPTSYTSAPHPRQIASVSHPIPPRQRTQEGVLEDVKIFMKVADNGALGTKAVKRDFDANPTLYAKEAGPSRLDHGDMVEETNISS